MEIIVAQPFGGQLVEVGRLDRTAIGRKLTVTDVVEHDEDNIRRACGRSDRHGRTEIRERSPCRSLPILPLNSAAAGKDFAPDAQFRRLASRRREQAERQGQAEGGDCSTSVKGNLTRNSFQWGVILFEFHRDVWIVPVKAKGALS